MQGVIKIHAQCDISRVANAEPLVLSERSNYLDPTILQPLQR